MVLGPASLPLLRPQARAAGRRPNGANGTRAQRWGRSVLFCVGGTFGESPARLSLMGRQRGFTQKGAWSTEPLLALVFVCTPLPPIFLDPLPCPGARCAVPSVLSKEVAGLLTSIPNPLHNAGLPRSRANISGGSSTFIANGRGSS